MESEFFVFILGNFKIIYYFCSKLFDRSKVKMRNSNTDPTPNPSPTWEGRTLRKPPLPSLVEENRRGSRFHLPCGIAPNSLPSLVGNCELGAIGERSDGGAKPGVGGGVGT